MKPLLITLAVVSPFAIFASIMWYKFSKYMLLLNEQEHQYPQWQFQKDNETKPEVKDNG